MDEMSIKTFLLRNAISKIINKKIKELYGINVNVGLDDFVFTYDETPDIEEVRIHVELNSFMKGSEFNKLITKLGF